MNHPIDALRPMAIVVAILFMFLHQIHAHTWNEQLAVIGSDGNFTGSYGYPRGYVARTDPGFNDDMMTYLLPPDGVARTRVNSQDLVCAPTQQEANQTSGYPRLQVAPGSTVAMKYLENGHVTEPYNQPGKPAMAGTVYVFGTANPNPQEKLVDVMLWNAEGTGGDARGVLLAAENFDDGRCHQINTSPMSIQRQQEYPDPTPGQPGTFNELWCETDITMPSNNLTTGSLFTVYWVWQWPTAPGVDPTYPDGKDEYYTTCSDFEVVAQVVEGPVSNTLVQQDPMPSADAGYLSRTALTPTPSLYKTAAATPTTATSLSATNTAVPLSSVASSLDTSALGTSMPAIPTSSISYSLALSTPTVTYPSSALPLFDVSYTPPASTAPADTQTIDSAADIFTATIYVTASLPPGENTLIVEGTHQVTFIRPTASSVALATPTASTTSLYGRALL